MKNQVACTQKYYGFALGVYVDWEHDEHRARERDDAECDERRVIGRTHEDLAATEENVVPAPVLDDLAVLTI